MDLSRFVRQISEMNAQVAKTIDIMRFGSYAERHPMQGKMVNCPLCGRRRRELPLTPCCNTAHATTQRAWSPEKGFYQAECLPRVNEENAGIKNLVKRFKHKRHSNKLRKQVHDLSIALQNDEYRNTTQYLLEGLPGFWEPQQGISLGHIPSFAERVVRNIRRSKADKKDAMAKQSRKENR